MQSPIGSNHKGAVAEAEIAAAATRLGIPVLKPLSEHGRYDLVFDLRRELARVQCKWGRLDRGGDIINVHVGGSRHTPRGYVLSSYAAGEIDFLAVYCGELDRCYLLPETLVVGKRGIHLRLVAPRNAQRACITLASDVEFPGAIAQLGERLSGTQEVAGSSPASSTPEDRVVEIGAHEFRERFGYWMDRAAAGAELVVTRHGKPTVRLTAAGLRTRADSGMIA